MPLNALGALKPIVGPETVPHYNNYASALINGAPAPGFSSSQAVAAMQRAAARGAAARLRLRMDRRHLSGAQRRLDRHHRARAGDLLRVHDSRRAIRELVDAVHGAVLGAARAGRLARRDLACAQMQVDVYSQIGFVMLIGLAAKNAILIVEFAKRRREEGLSIVESAMEAGRLRLRPILMTAFAFIFGVLPLMFATGAGAASRQSLGTAVFGGMLAATALTLGVHAGILLSHRAGAAKAAAPMRP